MSTMPARNYSVITASPVKQVNSASAAGGKPSGKSINLIGESEEGLGSGAAYVAEKAVGMALNVVIRVEVDGRDSEGKTLKYEFTSKLLISIFHSALRVFVRSSFYWESC